MNTRAHSRNGAAKVFFAAGIEIREGLGIILHALRSVVSMWTEHVFVHGYICGGEIACLLSSIFYGVPSAFGNVASTIAGSLPVF